MDIEKAYENIVLRDLLEYLTPGAISLAGVFLFIDAVAFGLGLGFSVFNKIHQSGLISGILLAPLAYVLGHHLTEVRYIAFGDKEADKASRVLSKDTLLKSQAVQVTSEYLKITNQEAGDMLNDSASAEAIRELGRSIIYCRLPQLHREFVGRHSILSRMSRNLSIALTESLLFALASSVFVFGKIKSLYQNEPVLLLLAVASLCLLITALISLYSTRASKLRDTMTKHTFQIWYADLIQRKLDNSLSK